MPSAFRCFALRLQTDPKLFLERLLVKTCCYSSLLLSGEGSVKVKKCGLADSAESLGADLQNQLLLQHLISITDLSECYQSAQTGISCFTAQQQVGGAYIYHKQHAKHVGGTNIYHKQHANQVGGANVYHKQHASVRFSRVNYNVTVDILTTEGVKGPLHLFLCCLVHSVFMETTITTFIWQ